MLHFKINAIALFSAESGTIWLGIITSYNKGKLISVAERSKACISGGSFAGASSSNPPDIMEFCLLWLLYVVM